MLPEVLAAAAVGISFSNAWLCMLLSFGCGGESTKVGIQFILGRFFGLIVIGIGISMIGAITDIPPIYFARIFAVASITFGVFILIGLYAPPEGKFRPIRHAVRRSLGLCKKHQQSNPLRGPHGAFVVGVLRGATPCVKLMVLAPLLICSGPVNAIALIVVYALASTIYPLIGFLTASALTTMPKYENILKLAGAIILIFVGSYVFVNEFISLFAAGGI